MADTNRRTYVDSPLTLRQLIQAAYLGQFRDRFDNAERDVKKRARVETVTQWKINYPQDTPVREKVNNFRIKVVSIRPDGTVSNYPVVVLIDRLDLDAPVKVRCGGLFKYRSRDTMKEKRLCGDFHFRFMNILSRFGVLYQRDTTNKKPPKQTNPRNSIGLCKHVWGAIIDLVESNFLGEGSTQNAESYAKLVQTLR